MRSHSQLAIAANLICLSTFSHLPAGAAESTFDGRWSVTLACADTTDKSGFVKGYEFIFAATVRGGELKGEYGAPGHPSSVFYSGTVGNDGTLEIIATGNTGRSEYSVGKVARGTPYSYTLHGKLDGSKGQATRREVRPCTATFEKT